MLLLLYKWTVRIHVYFPPWVYNRVEMEENNDSAIIAI